MKLEFNAPRYNNYTNTNLNCLVAIERNNSKLIGKTFKKYKKAKLIPEKITIEGFKFILDDEYQSLKIDFSTPLTFKVKDLEKADIV